MQFYEGVVGVAARKLHPEVNILAKVSRAHPYNAEACERNNIYKGRNHGCCMRAKLPFARCTAIRITGAFVEMEAYRYVLLYLSINSAPNDRDYTFETIMLDNKRAHIADAAASEDI